MKGVFLAILALVIVLKFRIRINSEHFMLNSGSLAYDQFLFMDFKM